ncbi:MAG: hypothetical protein ACJ8AD_01700, partial [Gemmatimonadaceae bacterium]
IGDVVDGVSLGQIDDEIQDVVGSYVGMRGDTSAWQAARLGLALAELTRVLPTIRPVATQAYFQRLAELARQALASIAEGTT